MKPPSFCFYQVPFSKKLEDIISLSCLRVCLFFFTTSFRYPAPSAAIALLLFSAGVSSQPLDFSHPTLHDAPFFVSRLLSILLGLIWLSLVLCRVCMQLAEGDAWRQEMQDGENSLRHRISALEDWIVLPGRKLSSEVIEVRYKQYERS